MCPTLSSAGLVDVVAVVLVVLAVLGALRRGRGLLAALASGVLAAVVVWLLVGAAVTWAPSRVADAARNSRLAHAVPLPTTALHQAERLLGDTSKEGTTR